MLLTSMRKYIYLITAIVLFIALIVLGTLFVLKIVEVNNLNAEKEELVQAVIQQENTINNLENTCELECNSEPETEELFSTFEETGFGVKFVYPTTWQVKMILEPTVDSYTMTPSLVGYSIEIYKGGTTIHVSKVLGGTGDLPEAIDTNTQEYKELGSGIVRVRDIGSNSWSYYTNSECFDMHGDATYCVAHFFPGFGQEVEGMTYATGVWVENASGSTLEEADKIVLSGVNLE